MPRPGTPHRERHRPAKKVHQMTLHELRITKSKIEKEHQADTTELNQLAERHAELMRPIKAATDEVERKTSTMQFPDEKRKAMHQEVMNRFMNERSEMEHLNGRMRQLRGYVDHSKLRLDELEPVLRKREIDENVERTLRSSDD